MTHHIGMTHAHTAHRRATRAHTAHTRVAHAHTAHALVTHTHTAHTRHRCRRRARGALMAQLGVGLAKWGVELKCMVCSPLASLRSVFLEPKYSVKCVVTSIDGGSINLIIGRALKLY